MRQPFILLIPIMALVTSLSLASHAGTVPPRPHAFALLVGSNSAGQGQKPLRYAHDDVRRVKKVLLELGGYGAPQVEVLQDPDRASFLAALEGARKKLAKAREDGNEPLFFFFYSGHARARALDLGQEQIALKTLRQRLMDLPAKATIAVLDACQTGAISRIKGASPTADFSYNSVNDLDTAGMAVMASSAGSELSQESDRLRASIFTHHLVVGLRGAADTDGDGRVTLAETYRYAYDRTLVATARTAVGKQHVTLETQLRGKGEMVLSFPLHSASTLVFPPELKGELLLHRREHVMAELHKASGHAIRLALPAGRYEALLRQGEHLRRCKVALTSGQVTTLSLRSCKDEPTEMTPSKGVGSSMRRYSLEVGFNIMTSAQDDYNERLEIFGYDRDDLLDFQLSAGLSVTLGYRLRHHFTLLLEWSMLDAMSYLRRVEEVGGKTRETHFSWRAHAIHLGVRAGWPLLGEHFEPYAELSGGMSFAFSTLQPALASEPEIDEFHAGIFLQASAGLLVRIYRGAGLFWQLSYSFAPALSNLTGDTHNSGGPAARLGLHFEI